MLKPETSGHKTESKNIWNSRTACIWKSFSADQHTSQQQSQKCKQNLHNVLFAEW